MAPKVAKKDKKQFRNLYRCLKHLCDLTNTSCDLTTIPSRCILLGNAGHANNIGKSDVDLLIKPSLLNYEIFFPPNKQFSVLVTPHVYPDFVTQFNLCPIKANTLYCSFLSEIVCLDTLKLQNLPTGLKVVENVCSELLEIELMEFFLKISKENEATQQDLKNRQTIHFGYKFDYSTNTVHLDDPLDEGIPQSVQTLVKELAGEINITPNQLTVNIYQPGQGIPKHVDTHSVFIREILSISLGSDVVMDFKNPETGTTLPVMIPHRSLTVMSGESRYLWHHGIAPRKYDNIEDITARGVRISLTLRECTGEPCRCDYPSQCDSQNYGKPKLEIASEEDAERVENEFVSEVYDDIATHFSQTRYGMWPGVVKFIEGFEASSLVLDVGCGNGKYLGSRKDLFFIGNDNSPNLCKICKERDHEVFSCNALQIPLRDNLCDGVICIAMLHHIASTSRRILVLQQLSNALKSGGLGLVTVWALEQHLDTDTTDLVQCPGAATEDAEIVGRRKFEEQDVFVDWQLKTHRQSNEEGKLYYRYYHVFNEGELEGLFKGVPSLKLIEVYYEKANWCAIFQKI